MVQESPSCCDVLFQPGSVPSLNKKFPSPPVVGSKYQAQCLPSFAALPGHIRHVHIEYSVIIDLFPAIKTGTGPWKETDTRTYTRESAEKAVFDTQWSIESNHQVLLAHRLFILHVSTIEYFFNFFYWRSFIIEACVRLKDAGLKRPAILPGRSKLYLVCILARQVAKRPQSPRRARKIISNALHRAPSLHPSAVMRQKALPSSYNCWLKPIDSRDPRAANLWLQFDLLWSQHAEPVDCGFPVRGKIDFMVQPLLWF